MYSWKTTAQADASCCHSIGQVSVAVCSCELYDYQPGNLKVYHELLPTGLHPSYRDHRRPKLGAISTSNSVKLNPSLFILGSAPLPLLRPIVLVLPPLLASMRSFICSPSIIIRTNTSMTEPISVLTCENHGLASTRRRSTRTASAADSKPVCASAPQSILVHDRYVIVKAQSH